MPSMPLRYTVRMDDDLTRVRQALHPITEASRTLAWARERPWTPETHVWLEHGAPCVDLHDLSVKLGQQAVEIVAKLAPALSTGAALFITGRGKHSVDGRSQLAAGVEETLARLEAEHGWSYRPQSRGRLVLLTDESRAPAALSGRLGIGFWAASAVFTLLAGLASPYLGLVVALVVLGLFWMDRQAKR